MFFGLAVVSFVIAIILIIGSDNGSVEEDVSAGFAGFGLVMVILLALGSLGYWVANEGRHNIDERFIITERQVINSVEFSPADNQYLVSFGEGRAKSIEKVYEITDGDDKVVLKGHQSERPWVLVPWISSSLHDDVYVFPHEEIEFIK